METVDIFKNLTEEQKSEFLKLQKTFESDGWPLLLQRANEQLEDLKPRATYANTWDENRVTIGMMAILEAFIALEEQINSEFEQLAEKNLNPEADSDESQDEILDEIIFE